MKTRHLFEAAYRNIFKLKKLVSFITKRAFIRKHRHRYQCYSVLYKFNYIDQIVFSWIDIHYTQEESALVFFVASKNILKEIMLFQRRKIWDILKRKKKRIQVLLNRIAIALKHYNIFAYQKALSISF
jgi:hypothetical protein